MPKNKWRIVSKKGQNFEIFFISIVAQSLAPANIGKSSPLQVALPGWLQVHGNRYFPKADLDRYEAKLKRLLKDKPKIIFNEYKYFLDLLNKMEAYAKRIPQANFGQLDLVAYLKEWAGHLSDALQYGYNYYFLNQPISKIVLGALEKNKVQDTLSVIEILSQAKRLSVIQQEKIDVLRLVKKIKEKRLAINSRAFKEEVKRHLKKYAFMGMFYFKGQPWQADEVVQRVKAWIKDNNWQTELKKMNQLKKIDLKTKQLIQKYKFTSYEREIISLMKEITYSVNRYDEVHNFFTYRSQKLLKYITQKLNITYKEFIEITYTELIDLLKTKKKVSLAFRKILRARGKHCALVAIKGQIKVLVGKDADKFFKKEVGEEKVILQDTLQGQCACQGKTTGKVVIFKSRADISKVKRGNIMVAASTVPSFVPAMEKAGAIITEMGGLLSHAAIVSRELNIPCIIGVNNATKILKTGNRVEVDATEGIVKKIK